MVVKTPFFWGQGGRAMTPADVARERLMADNALARGADTSPVDHWSQGLSRVVEALGGGLRKRRAGIAEEEGRAAAKATLDPIIAAIGQDGEGMNVANVQALLGASGDPWASEQYGGVISALLGREFQKDAQARAAAASRASAGASAAKKAAEEGQTRSALAALLGGSAPAPAAPAAPEFSMGAPATIEGEGGTFPGVSEIPEAVGSGLALSPVPAMPAAETALSFGEPAPMAETAAPQDDVRSFLAKGVESGLIKSVGDMAKYADIYETLNPETSASDPTEYGLTPQYYTTADGQLRGYVLGKDGSRKDIDIPEGSEFSKGVTKLDLGTSFQWYNTVTGQPIGEPISKNLAEAEGQKAAGRLQGEAEAQAELDAPGTIQSADETIRLIDEVLADPALPSVTGKYQGRIEPDGMMGMVMSQGALNLMPKIEQLQGKAFLQAFEGLKGGGQITEREGQAATAAITRLGQRYVDDETYVAALNDLKRIAENAKARARGETVPEYVPEGEPSAPVAAGSGGRRQVGLSAEAQRWLDQ